MRGNHANVQAAIDHPGLYVAERAHYHVQRHLGCLPPEVPDRLADTGLGIGDRLVEQSDRQGAGEFGVHLLHVRAKRLDGSQQRNGTRVNPPAVRGQGEPRTAAATQHERQPLLQVLDVAADRRAANVELEFGGRQATALHHGLEDPEKPDLGIAHLAEQRLLDHQFQFFARDGAFKAVYRN